MSPFKQAIANDVHTTFLNLAEFGENIDVDGTNIPAILDDNICDELDIGSTGDREYNGIYTEQRRLFVACTSITRPVEGQILTVASERYLVTAVREDIGVLEISLRRYAQ